MKRKGIYHETFHDRRYNPYCRNTSWRCFLRAISCVDVESALIVGAILVGGVLISNGARLPFFALKEALWGRGIKDVTELTLSVNFFKTASQLSIAGGVIGTVIGLTGMLAQMNDPSSIGGNMAVALITVFYGVLLSEAVFQPLKNGLTSKSITAVEHGGDSESVQRLVVLGLGLFVGFVPMTVLFVSMHKF